ncbi:hypothetical protein [Sneathiella aquimaris]|uniref:hypothetical protein n=1 Tax=Sneathiella aquimaris TaxID=2599305 RepID=UPI00146E5C64|nr:hypothetical protein [Sneathiella aquimaris]
MSNFTDKELDHLLPFYVNNSLSGAEKQAVEDRLKTDPDFDAERQFLVALQGKIKEQVFEKSPGEMGLARLHAAMGEHGKSFKSTDVSKGVLANDNSVQGWWRPVAVAACIALAVLGGIQVNSTLTEEGMVTASGGNASGPVLQVFFEERSTEKDIRSLLRQQQLNIIEGPTALGFYRVEILGADKGKDVEALIKKLVANVHVTEVLEE